MNIKILGGGCAKCKQLEKAAKGAIKELKIAADVEKVTDYADIVSYGVMSTPALVIDEKVVSSGRVLSVKEIKAILEA